MGNEYTRIVKPFLDLQACFNSSFDETKVFSLTLFIIRSWVPNPHFPQNNFQHDMTGICSSTLKLEVA